MTSEQLRQAQDTLESWAKSQISEPMTNYIKLNRLIKVIDEIDTFRREVWNKEKFGESEAIVNTIIDGNFTADDIPF